MLRQIKTAFLNKKLIIAFLIMLFFAFNVFSDPIMGIPGSEDVLVIYIDDPMGTNYNEGFAATFIDRITAAGGNVTTLTVAPGDNDGINDDLIANGITLTDYCQVWDLRFNDANQGIGFMNSGVWYDDSITSGTPTSDLEMFRDFMLNGGHLYLQAEHQNFYGRNESVLQFIADVAGAVSYPGLISAAYTWNTFAAVPELFSTDYNTLTQMDTNFTGTILLSGVGNGRPITTDGTNSLDLAFLSTDLVIGSGRLFINFDTNAFDPGDTYYTVSQEGEYIQNVYDFLADCYMYTITKTINPSEMCTGDQAVYEICYENTGDTALANVDLWDSIPTCFSIVSTSDPVDGQIGNLIWWSFSNIAVGASACIQVTVQADSVPPCP